MSPTQSRCRLKSLSRYQQIDTVFFSLMESDLTDELLTIIGIFTLFFALEMTLPERQFFRTLTKLIEWHAARRTVRGIVAIGSQDGAPRGGVSPVVTRQIPGICGAGTRRTDGCLRPERTERHHTSRRGWERCGEREHHNHDEDWKGRRAVCKHL
ncbi:hypothetical protein K438DRAFT_1836172, partial [Mycena galopus ATCC 62051]